MLSPGLRLLSSAVGVVDFTAGSPGGLVFVAGLLCFPAVGHLGALECHVSTECV